jgi:hypothetical protein
MHQLSSLHIWCGIDDIALARDSYIEAIETDRRNDNKALKLTEMLIDQASQACHTWRLQIEMNHLHKPNFISPIGMSI